MDRYMLSVHIIHHVVLYGFVSREPCPTRLLYQLQPRTLGLTYITQSIHYDDARQCTSVKSTATEDSCIRFHLRFQFQAPLRPPPLQLLSSSFSFFPPLLRTNRYNCFNLQIFNIVIPFAEGEQLAQRFQTTVCTYFE